MNKHVYEMTAAYWQKAKNNKSNSEIGQNCTKYISMRSIFLDRFCRNM